MLRQLFRECEPLLDLQRVHLYGCGMLRGSRKGFPADLKPLLKKGLKKRGDSVTRQDGFKPESNLAISAWQDNKVVVVAATSGE